MENKPEVIRQEMRETRASLLEKIDALESHLMNTVSHTTDAFNQTVNTVRDAVQGTVTQVKSTVDDTLTNVRGVVGDVRGAVGDTALSVRHTFGETVGSVRDTFDVERQADRHPLLLVGGAVCAGYVGGKLLQRLSEPSHPAVSAYAPTSALASAPYSESGPVSEPAASLPPQPENGHTGPHLPGWADSLVESFRPELNNLKGLAIGAIFNLAKGLIRQHTPPALEPQIEDVIDRLTTRFGGRRVEGSILDQVGAGTHR